MNANPVFVNRHATVERESAPVSSDEIILRAATEADSTLCEALFIEHYQSPLLLAGWDVAQCHAYLQPQFAMREQQFQNCYPHVDHTIIEVDGESVGRLLVDRQPQLINIIDMILFPVWCARAIGSYLLDELCREADKTGKALVLHVACDNPAQRLYQRLGFEVKENEGVYRYMRREPK